MATGSDDLSTEKGSPLTEWGEKTGRTSIELAVLGRAGIGKSSLINGIIGMELAKEGDDFDPGTKVNHDIRVTKNGIEVVLWELPGLGMDDPEVSHQRLKEMKSKSRCIDLLLYCIKMNNKRWPDYCERQAITNITGTFGKRIWQNCQFTLTFGNQVAKNTSDKDEEVLEFKKRVEQFTDRIREVIQKHADLTDEEAAKLPVVPVGDPHKKSTDEDFCHDLPSEEDWFINLFKSCIHTMQKEAVVPFLCVRAFNDNSINPQDVHDLHSAYPMTTRMDETEDRSLDLDKENDPEGHTLLEAENDLSHKCLIDHIATQQVDEGSIEEYVVPGENGKTDNHLDQQHIDNVQDDMHDNNQELHQRKLSHREIQAVLKKDDANLRQYIAKYISVRRSETTYMLGFVGGFLEAVSAWIETKIMQ